MNKTPYEGFWGCTNSEAKHYAFVSFVGDLSYETILIQTAVSGKADKWITLKYKILEFDDDGFRSKHLGKQPIENRVTTQWVDDHTFLIKGREQPITCVRCEKEDYPALALKSFERKSSQTTKEG